MTPTLVSVDLRLSAPAYDFWVDVRLRCFGDRWLAVADIADEPELGLGSTARRALEGAVASLGRRAADAFLSDSVLQSASADIARQGRDIGG